MITFRKILAASAGKLVRAYFTEKAPDADLDLRCEPGERADAGGRLTSYYTGRDSRAHWRVDMPQAVAAALGIDPLRPPKDRELDRLFEARRADTGEAWSRHPRKNSAIDFTFAPHKSVSLAIEFAETPAEAAMLWTALDRTNDRAMRLIAADLGWARKGEGGEEGAELGAVGWCSFRHHQARPTLQVRDGPDGITYLAELPIPGDPHAHVHNALYNLVVTKDGRVGSLDTQRLTDLRALVYTAYAQAVLATELRAMGVRVEVDPSGRFAVLPAIRGDAVELFSKGHRRTLRHAKAFAERQGLEWSGLSAERKYGLLAAASAAERQSKAARAGAKAEGSTEREAWRAQAAAIGWEHRTVLEGAVSAPLTDAERFEAAYRFAARHLAEEFRTAAVLDRDVLDLWAVRGLIGVGIKGAEDIRAVVHLIEERGIELHGERAHLFTAVMDGRVRVTNSVQVAIERRLGELAAEAARNRSGALRPEAITAATARSGLRFDDGHGRAQVAAMHALGTGGAVSFLTGVAGAGKSTIVGVLVDAYRRDTRSGPAGREVVGVANGWVQADALKDAGVRRTYAMEPLLRAIESGEFRPDRDTVLVVEEMGQVAPRAFLRLLELQAQTGFSIKALGDREQCQAIEAGSTVEILNRVLPKADRPELLSTVRQKTLRLKAIAGLFRCDDPDAAARWAAVAEALRMKRDDGTARMLGGDQDEVVAGIADFYVRRRDVLLAAGHGRGVTASALTNADAAEISAAIRARLKARGEIAAEERVYRAQDQNRERYDLPIAVGDRLRLYRKTGARIDSHFGFIGSNGDVVRVERVTDAGLVLRDKDGRVGEVEWRRLKAPGTSDRLLLGFGWCQTVDAIQGVTSVEHLNCLPRGTAGMTKFKGYTAESRAEWDTWTLIGEAAVFEAVRAKRALGDRAPVTSEDLWRQAATDLSRAPYKPLGMDLLERLRMEEGAAIDRFLAGEHRVQAQRVAGRRHGNERAARAEAEEVRRALTPRVDDFVAATRKSTVVLAPESMAAGVALGRVMDRAGPRPTLGIAPAS